VHKKAYNQTVSRYMKTLRIWEVRWSRALRCGWLTESTASEVGDVVYLLTSDEDVRDGKWTVAANVTPVKTSNDVVGFQLERLVKGKSVLIL